MMTINKRILLIISFLVCFLSFSQITDSERSITKIKDEVTYYLTLNKVLKSNSAASIVIVELLDISPLGYHDVGIYGIGAHISHSPSFVMLKSKNEILILNPIDVNTSIRLLLEFMEKNIRPEEKKVKYIYKVAQIFNDNLDNSLKKVNYKYCWKKIE